MDNRSFPFMMKSIAAITSVATAVLVVIHAVFPQPWIFSTCISFGTTAYHFVMRLAVGYIIPRLTHYNFDYHHPWFQPRSWEPDFYQKLNIRHWKNRLPTYAPELYSTKDNSLYRIIQNMCGAEIVHEIIMALSFLPLLMVPLFGAFPVFLITSVLSALFDGIFVIAQRFNRPRLIRIYEKQEAKRP